MNEKYRLHFHIPMRLRNELGDKIKLPGALNDKFPRGYWTNLIVPYLEAYNRNPELLRKIVEANVNNDAEALDKFMETL